MENHRTELRELFHAEKQLSFCKYLPWLFVGGFALWLAAGIIGYPIKLGCYLTSNPSRAVLVYERHGSIKAAIAQVVFQGGSTFAEAIIIWRHCKTRPGFQLLWPLIDADKAYLLQENFEKTHQ